MHTAHHIVAKCLSGKLAKGRTIILVTHHISLCLPISSYLVELTHGLVLRQGSIESLREQNQLQKALEDEKKYDTYAEPEQIAEAAPNEADALRIDNAAASGQTNGKLIEVEARAEGRVSMRTYLTYIRAAGTWSWVLSVLLMLCIRLINVFSQVRSNSMFSMSQTYLVVYRHSSLNGVKPTRPGILRALLYQASSCHRQMKMFDHGS